MNVFALILAMVVSIDSNNLQSAKNRIANDVKLVLKRANEHFCPYLGSGSFDRLKITLKVQKLENKCRKTGFKAGE